MSNLQLSEKYYVSKKDIRKKLKTMTFMSYGLGGTLLYALVLENSVMSRFMFYLALAYIPLMISTALTYIPRLNYTQLSSKGMHVTSLGIFHRTIPWSNIASIKKIRLVREDLGMIGVMFKQLGVLDWRARGCYRFFGWHFMLARQYKTDGTPLSRDAKKHLKLFGQEH